MLRPRFTPSPSARVGDAGALILSAKDAGVDAAKSEARKRLRDLGLTDAQIDLLVQATGMSLSDLYALGKDKLFEKLSDAKVLAVAYAKARISEQAVKGMMDLGFSRADAEALAATGGDPEALKKLGKEKLKDLLVDLTARAKKEGIDLAKLAADKTGMSPDQIATLSKGASMAYDIFTSVLSASEVLGASRTYSQAGWSGEFEGDDTLKNLGRTLDSMASQSDVQRKQREAAFRATTLKIAATASTAGPWGVAVGVALWAVGEGLNALGLLGTGPDDNEPKWRDVAQTNAKRLWKDFGFVPPAFDSGAYSLRSYAEDGVGLQLQLLDAAEAERPFREAWRSLVTWSVFQPLAGGSVQPHPAATDLVLLDWMPFSFSEWLGGTISPVMSNLGFSMSSADTYVFAPADMRFVEAVERNPYVPLFRVMPKEARDAFFQDGALPSWYPSQKQPVLLKGSGGAAVLDFYPAAPRSFDLQRLIRDRISATVGTLVAASRSVRIEPVVEAAVRVSRAQVAAHGFDPKLSAQDFRDVFLTAVEAAGGVGKKIVQFKNVPSLTYVEKLHPKPVFKSMPSTEFIKKL